jgi:hypothetical protein
MLGYFDVEGCWHMRSSSSIARTAGASVVWAFDDDAGSAWQAGSAEPATE